MVLSLAIVTVGAARADTAKLTIASDGCSTDDVRRQVIAQVGNDPFDDGARKRIIVDIRGTTATVGLAGAERSLGQRTLTAKSCTELMASVAVVLAMTISHVAEPSSSLEQQPLAAGLFVAGAADLGGATTLTTGVQLWRGHW